MSTEKKLPVPLRRLMNTFKVDGLTRALTRQLEILHPDLEIEGNHLKTYIFLFFLGFPI